MKFLLALGLLTATLADASPWQPFTSLSLSQDGRFLATGGLSGEVLYWDAVTGNVLNRWQTLDESPVVGLEFDSHNVLGVALLDGSGYTATREENELRPSVVSEARWKVLGGAVKRWLTGMPMGGVHAEWGGFRAEGSSDGQIIVKSTGPEIKWKAHGAAVTGLVWNPDGQVLYSSSYDGGLARWDAKTGKNLGRL